jgi:hypothetical protein
VLGGVQPGVLDHGTAGGEPVQVARACQVMCVSQGIL